MRRLRHLHRRMPGRRDDPRGRTGRDGPRAAAGADRPPDDPGARRRALAAAVERDPRGTQARAPVPVGRPVRLADRAAGRGVAGLAIDEGGRPDGPQGTLPGRLPGRHGCRSVRRADRRRPLRRGLCGRRRGQPVPVGLRLDLHRAVRKRLPPRRPRRADRDPDAQALRRRARQPARGRTAGGQADREGRHRRRRPGRHVRGVLPRAARLPGDRVRGDADPRRDDGHRDPVLPAAARCPAGRDRPDREPRRRAQGRHRDGSRLHARRPREPGLSRRLPVDRRIQEPSARRSG